MLHYNPHAWYWAVATFPLQVWSSAALGYVDRNNAGFANWVQRGHQPTKIGTPEELLQVMQHSVQPHVMRMGVTVESQSTPALNAVYRVTEAALLTIGRLAITLGPKRGNTKTASLPDANGTPHTFMAAQLNELVTACDAYVMQWAEALAHNVAGTVVAYPSNIITIS